MSGFAIIKRRRRSGGGGYMFQSAAGPFTSIAADGWQATYPAPPTFDPVGAPVTLAVTRQGFNASGSPVTVADTVTAMKRVRNPWSAGGAQNTLTADQVAMSDFIYTGDTLPAGVVNNSTRAAPLPIAMWLTPDLQIIKSNSMTLRLAVAHAHAQQGRPAAAVRFIITDGTNTVTQTVSAMTPITYPASGLTVPHFAATLDISTLTQGATLTIDAEIFPWVGAKFTISTDASAYPSPNLTTLRALCDRTGAYGQLYAYVDTVAGVDGAQLPDVDPLVAAASPFLTVNAALTAISARSNTLYGRNNCGGHVVRQAANTTVTFSASIRVAAGTLTWPVLYEAADAAQRANTVFATGASSLLDGTPYRMIFKDVTIRRGTTGSFNNIDQNAFSFNYSSFLMFQNCYFDLNGTSNFNGWIHRCSRVVFLECSASGFMAAANVNGGVNKTAHVIGCGTGLGGSQVYMAAGSINAAGQHLAATSAAAAAAGSFTGWCFMTSNFASPRLSADAPTGARGWACVGTVFEAWGTDTTQPTVVLWADSNVDAAENVVFMGNTVVGQRMNWLYQDAGTVTVPKSGYLKWNSIKTFNIKTDVFDPPGGDTPNAARIGNWPAAFMVGAQGNNFVTADTSGSTAFGAGEWNGELRSLGSTNLAAPAYLAPGTQVPNEPGTGLGNGDYTPGAGSALPFIPSGQAPWSHDQKGRAISNAGTARIGALQPL